MFFQLAVVLFFPKFVYMQEAQASCRCGQSSKEDCIEAENVETAVQKLRSQFMDNHQYCYEYRLLEGTNCETAIPFISKDTIDSLPVEITESEAVTRQYRTATPNLSEGYIVYH